tara:strand:- start:631 stop:864 length:234 start_codon:yes stop_codon:yes gene_type:complete
MTDNPDEFEIDYLGERYRPLIIVGWDTFKKAPCVSMETRDWDDLSYDEEQEVFAAVAALAIDFAPLMGMERFIEDEN